MARDLRINQMFRSAVEHHRTGRLAEAGSLYRQILRKVPQHADSLHRLGLLSYQNGNLSEALIMLRRAVAANSRIPSFHSDLGDVLQAHGDVEQAIVQYRCALKLDAHRADTLNNLGLALQRQGSAADALSCFDQAIQLRPDVAELHCHKGDLLRITGDLTGASACYQRALELNPNIVAARNNLGTVFESQGRLDDAAFQYGKVRELKPELVQTYNNLGNIHLAQGRTADAVAHYEHAIRLDPSYAEAHTNLGVALAAQGRLDEAVNHHQRAIALNPGLLVAYDHLGKLLHRLKRWQEAIVTYGQAIKRKGDFAEAQNDLGLTLHHLGMFDEAILCFRNAIQSDASYAGAHVNAGNAYRALGRIDDAAREYGSALALQPEFAEAHLNLSMVELLQGEFTSGWARFEWRWRTKLLKSVVPTFSQLWWRGEPLSGKRILLHSEQGLGDSLQFVRYSSLVQAVGGTVILRVQPALRRLASMMPSVAETVSDNEELPLFDCHCPFMSLPSALGTTISSIPNQVPYLQVPPEARDKALRHSWPPKGLRVGLVWAGDPTNERDHFRSIALSALAPILALEGIHFFSLQVGTASKQIGEGETRITDLSSEFMDMADTAAHIEHLDLVISVDTSVAHLAGALGKPVWILLSTVADVRWFLEREDSPWYPTARLFRQKKFMDWSEVMERVVSALHELASTE